MVSRTPNASCSHLTGHRAKRRAMAGPALISDRIFPKRERSTSSSDDEARKTRTAGREDAPVSRAALIPTSQAVEEALAPVDRVHGPLVLAGERAEIEGVVGDLDRVDSQPAIAVVQRAVGLDVDRVLVDIEAPPH